MKREDVKNKIPGITEEQLNWIMQENGADINREKAAATALQTQLNNVNAQLKTAVSRPYVPPRPKTISKDNSPGPFSKDDPGLLLPL